MVRSLFSTVVLSLLAAGPSLAAAPALPGPASPPEAAPSAPAEASPAQAVPNAAPAATNPPPLLLKPLAESLPPAEVLPPALARPRRDDDDPLVDTTYWSPGAREAWEGASDILHDHLRVGLRYRQVSLRDESRTLDNSFLGSITELDNDTDYDAFTFVTFEWLATPYIAIRFNMEQLRAETGTTSYDNHTDGTVDLSGPQLMLVLRLPNASRFTPTAGLGYIWFSSTFEHNPAWYNGFGGPTKEADYDAWVASGSPPWPNHGYRREIILDDTSALVFMGGLEIQLTDHLDFYLFVQDMEVEDVDVTYNLSFGGNVFESTHAQFPMSNIGYGAGLRWTF